MIDMPTPPQYSWCMQNTNSTQEKTFGMFAVRAVSDMAAHVTARKVRGQINVIANLLCTIALNGGTVEVTIEDGPRSMARSITVTGANGQWLTGFASVWQREKTSMTARGTFSHAYSFGELVETKTVAEFITRLSSVATILR